MLCQQAWCQQFVLCVCKISLPNKSYSSRVKKKKNGSALIQLGLTYNKTRHINSNEAQSSFVRHCPAHKCSVLKISDCHPNLHLLSVLIPKQDRVSHFLILIPLLLSRLLMSQKQMTRRQSKKKSGQVCSPTLREINNKYQLYLNPFATQTIIT